MLSAYVLIQTKVGKVAHVAQALGHEAFLVEAGEPFTPSRMEPSATLTAHPAWS